MPRRSDARTDGRRRTAVAAVAAAGAMALFLALGLTGCADGDPGADGAGHGRRGPFWVNPGSNSARQADRWEEQGRADDAGLLRRIARRPVAEWIGGERPAERAGAFTAAASASGTTAVLVAYYIPHRDCGQYSTGGARTAVDYRAWLEGFARGVGDRSAVVVLEPDALTHMVDGCTPAKYHGERYRLLRAAVRTLAALPHTTVYLDAGNSGWIEDPARLVAPLRRAGVRLADGFALNVSNFQTTTASRAYGHRLSRALGGAHFVIDTSRNGRGPLAGDDHGRSWCNPPGRALGPPPTRRTGDPLVDAYLWIKRPGDSDGECRGAPPAGRWWPDYALELARNTKP